MRREITRKELLEALAAIGIRPTSPEMWAKAYDGTTVRLNGQGESAYICLVVEVTDKAPSAGPYRQGPE